MTKKIRKVFFLFVFIFLLLSFSYTTVITLPFSAHAMESVYLGGYPIGITAESDGLIVKEFINVTTPNGSFSPALQAGLKKGDVIVEINGKKPMDLKQLQNEISVETEYITVKVLRNNKEILYNVKPEKDLTQNERKIGLILKKDIAGIGTMTYVTQNGRYGALGHRIGDSFGNDFIYSHGKIYNCEISGYKTATSDVPGELIGKIFQNEEIGSIEKNSFCGIFGIHDAKNKTGTRINIPLGHKEKVHPGKATIYTTTQGNTPKEYNIEIIRAFSQETPAEKSMVIRVTDKTLLSTTKGILQGMSGSPILQDGKLIGAVTHVFTNDTTMGYGIYIDWMIDN